MTKDLHELELLAGAEGVRLARKRLITYLSHCRRLSASTERPENVYREALEEQLTGGALEREPYDYYQADYRGYYESELRKL